MATSKPQLTDNVVLKYINLYFNLFSKIITKFKFNLKIEIMSVLKVIELLASSTISWEDATQKRFKSLKNVKSVYVKNQSAAVSDGKISEYRATVKVTFELE
jgi:flavin-binding protein dodecin